MISVKYCIVFACYKSLNIDRIPIFFGLCDLIAELISSIRRNRLPPIATAKRRDSLEEPIIRRKLNIYGVLDRTLGLDLTE
jgi:hypothetical protein